MSIDLETADFAFDEMPGSELHDVLRGYRERGPVAPTRFMGLPSFVITSYEALSRAFQDEHRFPGHLMYRHSFEPAVGRSFISEEDPATHLRLRKLATPAFRSRAIARFEEEGLVALANELLDAVAGRDAFDLMPEYVARLPYLVITRLLGLPRDREDEFHGWAMGLLTFRDDPQRAIAAKKALSEFLAPVVEARRAKPADDVISELVGARVDGGQLDDEAIFSTVRLLFPAGGETTHGSLANLLYALLAHEGAWADVVARPETIDAAVAEALRWETSIAVLPRMSRDEPVEFEGVEIPASSWVMFASAGANRDPAVVEDPDRFDPTRKQPPTLVFGRGPKSCPGMHLAKKTMAVAVRVLAERMPDLELVDPAEAMPRRSVLRCPAALRVRRTG